MSVCSLGWYQLVGLYVQRLLMNTACLEHVLSQDDFSAKMNVLSRCDSRKIPSHLSMRCFCRPSEQKSLITISAHEEVIKSQHACLDSQLVLIEITVRVPYKSSSYW